MSILFVGDWLPLQPIDLARLFGKCKVIGNLECAISPIAKSGDKAHSVILDEVVYRNIQTSGFTALSLANNHVNDAGEDAFRQMVNELKETSTTQYYGIVEQPYASLDLDGMSVAVIGCLEPCRSRGRTLFSESNVHSLILKLKPRFDRIIVTPHWGKESEYAYHPSPRQRKLAKSWAEAGADGIIGHHPHVIQGGECDVKKRVYYSIGNFEFLHDEGRAYPATLYGMAVKWIPSSNAWCHQFVTTESGSVQAIGSSSITNAILTQHFKRLSEELTKSSRWLCHLTWARRIGPVYIPKNWKSWRRRMKKRFAPAFAKFCVWSILPKTVLLFLGSLFPDRKPLAESKRTFVKIKEINES